MAVPMLVAILAGLLPAACGGPGRDRLPDPAERDWAAIQEGDTLRALFTYNATGYFIYRGEAMGYEFRLLRAFAEDHGLVLEPVVVRDRAELFKRLNEGDGDVVAARLIAGVTDSANVAFTDGLYRTRPVLVQRSGPPGEVELPEIVDTLVGPGSVVEAPAADTAHGAPAVDTAQAAAPAQVEGRVEIQARVRLVRGLDELADEDVHVPNRSPYYERLIELSDSLTGDIHVVEVEGTGSSETLIRRLARGEITFTVAPENVAELSEEYYTNVTIRPVLDAQDDVVWAVRQNAPELLRELNAWIADPQNEGLFAETYATYFEEREGFRERVASEYLTSETGQLSEYDPLLRTAAQELGWDWRLLASQAFQESRFDPNARSWAGAVGILQIMPGTARDMGVRNLTNAEENIAGAVRYLQFLEERWGPKIPDEDERLRFVLASYNAGFGHVEDAQRLAEKNGDDPLVWEEVAYWLLQKSRKDIYTDPVVRYGFCRGLEPVTYVALILERFGHYQEFVTAEGPVAAD